MNFYISDTHFFHQNVIKFDSRPFSSVEEMNAILIKRWNQTVTNNNHVYILGDFIWLKPNVLEYKEIIKALNGQKHLIRGNHDPKQMPASLKVLFASIDDYKEITDDENHIILCHYPIPCYKAAYDKNTWMLYGHVHTTEEATFIERWDKELIERPHESGQNLGHLINVGCMMPYMDYTPRTFIYLKNFWNDKYCKKEKE